MKFIFLTVSLLLANTCIFSQNHDVRYKQGNAVASFATPSDIGKMSNYDVHFYKLDVNVERTNTYISGNAEIHAKAVKAFSEFVFELHDSLKIDSVFCNDVLKSFTRNEGVVTVNINGSVPANSGVVCKIYYKGNTPQGGSAAIGNGFSNSASRQVTWSLSESYVAYEWWPCKQVLYDKADSAEIWITTDSANKAGSNGLLKNTTLLPNGKKRFEWKTNYPIDYYLISVAVAKYTEYNIYAHPVGLAQPLLIQNYIYDSTVIPVLNYTPWLIETFSSVFGMYPFANEKYGHCMAPIGGGMEHQTMTTIGPKSAITFNIVAHELAHQWFGDYVTCGSWSDIWLNEGFASYSEYIANERWSNGSPVTWMSSTMAGAKNAWGWVQVHDTLSTSTLFNSSATYNKGAVILHMLRYEINNDSLFFEGIRRYLDTHKYNVAYSYDFQTEMEKISGKNLSFFFDQWLRGLGFPVFTAKWNQINNKVYIHLKQSTTNIATSLFKTTIDIRLVHFTGDTVIRVWVDSLSKVLVFDMGSRAVNTVQIDAAEHILNNVDSIYKDPLFTAIDDVRFSEKEIIFYPNPAKEMLNITNAGGCELEVIDITGRVQFHMVAGENIQSLDLKDMARGIYFIRVRKNGFNTTRKFIKE